MTLLTIKRTSVKHGLCVRKIGYDIYWGDVVIGNGLIRLDETGAHSGAPPNTHDLTKACQVFESEHFALTCGEELASSEVPIEVKS